MHNNTPETVSILSLLFSTHLSAFNLGVLGDNHHHSFLNNLNVGWLSFQWNPGKAAGIWRTLGCGSVILLGRLGREHSDARQLLWEK